MDQAALAAIVLTGVIVLTAVAGKVGVPQPILLMVFGIVLALVPGIPNQDIPPDLILPVVLPPLLFAATQRTTVTEFRQHLAAVAWLAIGLTLATAAVVAVVAHACGLSWTTAAILGAVVSPPDPVAATAVARRLRLPQHLVTVLEGEGMFNDATALVLYKVAVAAAVAGSLSLAGVGTELVLAVVVGVAVGLLAGAVARFALGRIRDAYAETTVTVLVPFVAYVGADHLRGSGVLAVLVLGLYLRSRANHATTSQGWLLGRSVWSYADFLVTGVVFSLLGFELVRVIGDTPFGEGTVVLGTAVVGTLVAFRFAWVFATAGAARLRARRRDSPLPTGMREATVVSWAGMRGVVTVATALALPVASADGGLSRRDDLVVIALGCVLVTLLVQGLTLAPLTKWLGVGSEDDDGRSVARLRREAATAALEEIRALEPDRLSDTVRRAAVLQYEGYVSAQAAMEDARRTEVAEDEKDPAEQLGKVLQRATDIERRYILDCRRRGTVSAEVADEVLRDVEGRAVRDLG